MAAVELDAEEAREVDQLVGLRRTWIALTGDHQGIEVATALEPVAIAESFLEEGQVEADVVANDRRVAGELEEAAGSLLREWLALDIVVGQAVHLHARDRATRIDQGRPAVRDLTP